MSPKAIVLSVINIHTHKNDRIFIVLAFQGTHTKRRAERQRWVFILRRRNVEVFIKSGFFFILKKSLGQISIKGKTDNKQLHRISFAPGSVLRTQELYIQY